MKRYLFPVLLLAALVTMGNSCEDNEKADSGTVSDIESDTEDKQDPDSPLYQDSED